MAEDKVKIGDEEFRVRALEVPDLGLVRIVFTCWSKEDVDGRQLSRKRGAFMDVSREALADLPVVEEGEMYPRIVLIERSTHAVRHDSEYRQRDTDPEQ